MAIIHPAARAGLTTFKEGRAPFSDLERRFLARPGLRRAAIAAFLAIPFAGSGAAAQSGPREHEVRAAVEAFGAAYVAGDSEALGGLLTSDYIHVNGGSGSVLDRGRWLDWISSRREDLAEGRLVIEEYEVRDLQIRIHGETAVVIGSVFARERRAGEVVESRVRFTNVWVHAEDGRWRRAAFHDSPLP